MNRFRLVVFDLDGTILDTLEDIRNSINYVLRCYDMRLCTPEEVRRYVGHGFANALRSAIREKSDFPVEEGEFALMLALLRRHYENNATNNTLKYPGMEDLLETLTSKGIEVGVLTNKDERVARPLCEAFYPDVRFSFIEGKRENRPLKPDASLTLSVLETVGIARDEAIFVGDSEVDYESARNIGAPSVIVSYGFRTKDELEESGIGDVAESVDELRERLFQLLFA